MKRIIGIFILILLLFSIATPVNIVFASELSDSIIMRLTETHSNSDIEITVKLVTNTGVSGMTLELVYNKNVFEYAGYEKGSALENLDLISTNASADSTLPIKFNWYNQNLYNDFSTGNILKLHFTLKPNALSGEYEIGFKYDDGDIMYIENSNISSKSAIISKAIVNVSENKIAETQIVEGSNESQTNILLILGIVTFSISVVAVTTLFVIKIKKEKARKKNWLKI